MCSRYHVRGEDLTLKEVLDRLRNKPVTPPRVVYSKQEIASASKVLERLASRVNSTSYRRV